MNIHKTISRASCCIFTFQSYSEIDTSFPCYRAPCFKSKSIRNNRIIFSVPWIIRTNIRVKTRAGTYDNKIPVFIRHCYRPIPPIVPSYTLDHSLSDFIIIPKSSYIRSRPQIVRSIFLKDISYTFLLYMHNNFPLEGIGPRMIF